MMSEENADKEKTQEESGPEEAAEQTPGPISDSPPTAPANRPGSSSWPHWMPCSKKTALKLSAVYAALLAAVLLLIVPLMLAKGDKHITQIRTEKAIVILADGDATVCIVDTAEKQARRTLKDRSRTPAPGDVSGPMPGDIAPEAYRMMMSMLLFGPDGRGPAVPMYPYHNMGPLPQPPQWPPAGFAAPDGTAFGTTPEQDLMTWLRMTSGVYGFEPDERPPVMTGPSVGFSFGS